jgi:hypothetical protein
MSTDASVRRSRALWVWLLAAFGGAGVALLVVFAVAVAVLGASFSGCQPGEETSSASSSGPAPSAYALASIPPERLQLYEAAGTRFDIDWSFLASIGTQECASGNCMGVNSSGCAGPMQIAYVRGSACSPGPGPTLWERYAVNADPGHALSVNDPADAIFTAARILREAMGAPPTGGTFAEYRQAACGYYGACADAGVSYAATVMARAVQYGFTGSGAPAPATPTLAEPVTDGCTAGPPPAPASASRIVRVAESQIGQGEHPRGSDCTIYGPCEEWCSLFASWVWINAGVPLSGSTALYGYSGSLYTWTKEHGGTVLAASARPAPGDLVFYGAGPGPGESKHVGIVQSVLSDGRITTIEGNYDGHVTRVGPFAPAHPVGERAGIYGYAQPPATRTNGEPATRLQERQPAGKPSRGKR